MAGVCKIVANVNAERCILSSRTLLNAYNGMQKRFFQILPRLRLREIYEIPKDDKTTVVEGKHIESPRTKSLLKLDGPKDACPLCKLNMKIKYTDVLIISQFVQEDGKIIPRSVTGLCYDQHKYMQELIHQAHRAGLMQSLRPHVFPEEYSQMSDFAWKRYNVYFTDSMDDY